MLYSTQKSGAFNFSVHWFMSTFTYFPEMPKSWQVKSWESQGDEERFVQWPVVSLPAEKGVPPQRGIPLAPKGPQWLPGTPNFLAFLLSQNRSTEGSRSSEVPKSTNTHDADPGIYL